MTKKHADWIVAQKNGEEFHCLRCGDTYSMKLPCPVTMWVAAAKAYENLHKACKEKR